MSAPAFTTSLVSMAPGLPADPEHPDRHLFAAARTWVEELNGRGEENSPEAKASLGLWCAAQDAMLNQDANTAEGMTVKLAMIGYYLDVNQVDDFIENETAGFNILSSLHRSAFNIATGKGCPVTYSNPNCPALNLAPALERARVAAFQTVNTEPYANQHWGALRTVLSLVRATSGPGALLQLACAQDIIGQMVDAPSADKAFLRSLAVETERLIWSARQIVHQKIGDGGVFDVQQFNEPNPFSEERKWAIAEGDV